MIILVLVWGYSGLGTTIIIIAVFSSLCSPLTALSSHVLIKMPTLLIYCHPPSNTMTEN